LMNTRDHWRKPQACPMVKWSLGVVCVQKFSWGS
jgi:hypothetical protein